MGFDMGWNEVFWFMLVPFGIIGLMMWVMHKDGYGDQGGGE